MDIIYEIKHLKLPPPSLIEKYGLEATSLIPYKKLFLVQPFLLYIYFACLGVCLSVCMSLCIQKTSKRLNRPGQILCWVSHKPRESLWNIKLEINHGKYFFFVNAPNQKEKSAI